MARITKTTSGSKYKKGQKFTIAIAYSPFKIGEKVYTKSEQAKSNTTIAVYAEVFDNMRTDSGAYYIPVKNLKALNNSKEDLLLEISEFEKEITEAQSKIEMVKLKMAYMDEIKADVFDEDEFKAYSILKMLDQNKLSTYEKAKAIAALVNS